MVTRRVERAHRSQRPACCPTTVFVGAIPLAYALIVSGALVHNKYLRLPTDLSYGTYIYAFPMQQLLVICGLVRLNPFVFTIIATIATLPLAALSWFLIEKPCSCRSNRDSSGSVSAL